MGVLRTSGLVHDRSGMGCYELLKDHRVLFETRPNRAFDELMVFLAAETIGATFIFEFP